MKDINDVYKDSRWQKLRLKKLEQAGWKCECCGKEQGDGIYFSVRHKKFIQGRQVWEYSEDELIVLCNECNSAVQECREFLYNLNAKDACIFSKILKSVRGALVRLPVSERAAFVRYLNSEGGEVELLHMFSSMIGLYSRETGEIIDYSWFCDEEGCVRTAYDEKEYKAFADEEKERIEFANSFITDDDTRKIVFQFLISFLFDIKRYKFGIDLRKEKYTKLEEQQMNEFIHVFWDRLLNVPCDQLLSFLGLDKNINIDKVNKNICSGENRPEK